MKHETDTRRATQHRTYAMILRCASLMRFSASDNARAASVSRSSPESCDGTVNFKQFRHLKTRIRNLIGTCEPLRPSSAAMRLTRREQQQLIRHEQRKSTTTDRIRTGVDEFADAIDQRVARLAELPLARNRLSLAAMLLLLLLLLLLFRIESTSVMKTTATWSRMSQRCCYLCALAAT